jgi:hypothetical protein
MILRAPCLTHHNALRICPANRQLWSTLLTSPNFLNFAVDGGSETQATRHAMSLPPVACPPLH